MCVNEKKEVINHEYGDDYFFFPHLAHFFGE